MSSFELGLFGPPVIRLNHQSIGITKQKALALLVYLAVTRTQQRRDRLATLFWPDYDQSSARTYLRQALYELSQQLGEHWFITSREIIGIAPGSDLQIDVHQFLELAIIPDKHRGEFNPVGMERLRNAIALYQDDFLAGFSLPDCPDFDEWQFFQTEQLRQRLGETLQTLISWYTTQQAYTLAIDYTQRWINLDPLQEIGHRTLMELYAISGQYANALHQYEECVRLLQKELDAPPDETTKILYEAIKTRRFPTTVPGLEPLASNVLVPLNGEATTRRVTPSTVSNLPLIWSPLIGREADLTALTTLFAQANIRLISLVGPGGMGKTRLAVAAAEQQHKVGHFSDGVYFVALAPLSDSESIIPAMADALAFSFEVGGQVIRTPKQQLVDYLRHKQLLLVLDNFEHLLEGVDFVLEILQMAPEIKILVTAREQLRIHEEQIYLVKGLAYAQEKDLQTAISHAAGELFHQRACRAQADFALTPIDSGAVDRICQLVEGMPLGIELAAAWVNVLPLAAIVAEIERSLDFLSTEVRDVPPRHRSIRAVFDATWQQLRHPEQMAFTQLSIFRGGFTRQAAQQVTGATFLILASLATKGLIRFDKQQDRYTVHELLRQYGADKLAQQPEQAQLVHNRLSAHYCAWLQQQESELKGAKQREALTEIEIEHENVRMAWQWALTYGHWDRLRQAMDILGIFYEWQGRYEEGDAIFQATSAVLAPIPTPEVQLLFVKTLAWRTVFLRTKGPLDLARQLSQQGLALLENIGDAKKDIRSIRAFVLMQMGHFTLEQDNQAAQSAYTESLLLYRTLDAPSETAAVLAGLGRVAQFLGDYNGVQTYYQESLSLYRRLGNHIGIATVLDALSLSARFQGRLEESEELAREGYEHHEQVGNQSSLAKGFFSLGQAVDWVGKIEESYTLIQKAIDIYESLGQRRGLADLYARISGTEMRLSQYTAARMHAQKGLILAKEFGDLRIIASAIDTLSGIASVEGRYLEAEQLALESLATYQALGVRAEEGRGYVPLAYFAWKRGDLTQAKEYFVQALRIGLELPDFTAIAGVLCNITVILAESGEVERAIELDALNRLDPQLNNSGFYQALIGELIAAASVGLSPEIIKVAQARGRSFDLWQMGTIWLEKLHSSEWPPRQVNEK